MMWILETVRKNENDTNDENKTKWKNGKCSDDLVLYVPDRTYSTFSIKGEERKEYKSKYQELSQHSIWVEECVSVDRSKIGKGRGMKK